MITWHAIEIEEFVSPGDSERYVEKVYTDISTN